MSGSTSVPIPHLSTTPKSYFEQQRAALILDIGGSLEAVLQNINKLNRNLEGIVAVGNEFSSVEALWSQFESVMGKAADGKQDGDEDGEVIKDQETNEA